MTPPATSPAPARWQLRYSWDVAEGISHPLESFDPVPSRELAVDVAWRRWPSQYEGMTLTQICVRELPDGHWELLLPVSASCG